MTTEPTDTAPAERPTAQPAAAGIVIGVPVPMPDTSGNCSPNTTQPEPFRGL